MKNQHGAKPTDIKEKNRGLALQLIATGQSVSRVDLARKMHLTKTTLGNIVSELVDKGIVVESPIPENSPEVSLGRKPIILDLSPTSPIIAGMLIKRNLLTVILADLRGVILEQVDYEYNTLNQKLLIEKLVELFHMVSVRQSRRIIAIGISSIGPINTKEQIILSPSNFWNIQNVPIGTMIQKETGKPTFLIHDCSAGALAERLYGAKAQYDNLIYLHIMNGIGAGYILHGKIYDGDSGCSGELGHMSIQMNGPRCTCGNSGCLELYANTDRMNEKIRSLKKIYPASARFFSDVYYNWEEIITGASCSDCLALSALDDFCEYLAVALQNVIRLLDIRHIVVGYRAEFPTNVVENILQSKLSTRLADTSIPVISVEQSSFQGDAPLIGSIAVVSNNIFSGYLNIY